ncbi:BA75_03080T0 [Komagataella pastoris]|uniref:BA75_03080T0 n=1 Tax=Komagataella pastoris TaxID=4922 RepID=A0A1B2JDM3_PICPA|nr:BA75_03080T0 [Komagataella pastoris]
MLGRARTPFRLRTPLGVPLRQIYRPISINRVLLQEQKKQENVNATDGVETPKRKPLSRIPIGAIPEANSQKIGSSGNVEFSTWKAVVLFALVGTAVTFFFKREKKRLELQKEADQNRGIGKPLVGGPFDLIDTNGEQFTQEKLKDKFSLIYFGFTHCPDICPDELDKLGLMLDELKSKYNIQIQPIFITCDPARDTPAVIEEYLKDFHPDIIGLTGTYDKIKECCKNFRVYFSTPRDVKAGQDYLVDHSIFFYLMDKEGEFIDVLGRQYDASGAVEKIKGHIDAYVPRDQRNKQKNSWYGFLFK